MPVLPTQVAKMLFPFLHVLYVFTLYVYYNTFPLGTLNLMCYSFGKSRVGLKQIELCRLSVLFEANCINKAVPNS